MTDTEQKRIKAICKVAHIGDISDLSDGYHTFKQLYYQRMMLFATIVKQNKDKAWKSLRHEDGELCFGGGWFVVGIDTPKGSYTYHYEDKYFGIFDCIELECGKHWDGHTEEDVTRLLSLKREPCDDCISCQAVLVAMRNNYRCGGRDIDGDYVEGNYSEKLYDAIMSLPLVTPQPKIGRWIMKHRSHNEIKHYTGQDEMGETHTISVLERYEADEPYCSECGKRAGDTSQDYCCACGAKMQEAEE